MKILKILRMLVAVVVLGMGTSVATAQYEDSRVVGNGAEPVYNSDADLILCTDNAETLLASENPTFHGWVELGESDVSDLDPCGGL